MLHVHTIEKFATLTILEDFANRGRFPREDIPERFEKDSLEKKVSNVNNCEGT